MYIMSPPSVCSRVASAHAAQQHGKGLAARASRVTCPPTVAALGRSSWTQSGCLRQDANGSARSRVQLSGAPGQSRRSLRTVAVLQTLPAPAAKAGKTSSKTKGPTVLSEFKYEDVGLASRGEQHGDEYKVYLRLDTPRNMVLHWAVDDWKLPPSAAWPSGTKQVDDKACQTSFGSDGSLAITFSKDICPTRIVFVLKQGGGGGVEEAWFNNAGANYSVQLRAPPLESFIEKVLTAEGTFSHWSLPQRLMLVTEVLDAADAAGPEGMAFIYTYLRLSSTRVLDWYRNANFQPKDIASMQKYAGERVADKARSSADPLNRLLARGALAGLPRGGGNGDEIRMGILHIMRGNGIKEGHRPGHDEPFLEQWHQKLHTATSPDDVTICEAYLAFLHSGNHDDYWRVLWDNGKLTREKMESWPKPIKSWPHHLPHLIPAFKGYLWTLKITHSGADLDMAAEMAKGFMDDDLRWVIRDILDHRNDWWVPGKIVEARERLANYWKAPGSSRDLALLDIALESWFRTCLERSDFTAMSGDDLIELVGLVLRGGLITVEDGDLAQCRSQWDRVRGGAQRPLPGQRWSRDWAQASLAAAERLQLSVTTFMDRLYELVQPPAQAFGQACRLDEVHIANFGEEVVRGQPLFLASLLLQRLEPMLRTAAGGAPWQVVSQSADSAGEVVAVAALADVQGASYSRPTLLLAASLTGVEDIPAGVVGLLTRSSTDVLSHLAIRARSQRVLLATCFDDDAWAEWTSRVGSLTAATIDPAVGAVLPHDAPAAAPSAASAAAGAASAGPLVELQAPEKTSAWAVPEGHFRAGLVGAKALNLKTLRDRLSTADIAVPSSVALPYGTFERVLREPGNAAAAAVVSRLTAMASLEAAAGALPKAELAELRHVVSETLVAPAALVAELAAAAVQQGLIPSTEAWTQPSTSTYDDEDDDDGHAAAAAAADPSNWPAVWSAICRVWASKWTDRAWLSRRAMKLKEEDLFMSVLLQQVIPVQYAFVLHTSNPVTHTKGELLGEMVVGMGETLVGNYPGRALGFTSTLASDPAAQPQVLSLPSKRLALHAPAGPTLIARSDANAEDLEQYAAAGLYDSVTLSPLVARPVDYATERLYDDPGFRTNLLSELAHVGHAVQEAFGGRDQDVEGGWVDGKFYVVQARPQVELTAK